MRTAALIGVAALLVSACGTRADEQDFLDIGLGQLESSDDGAGTGDLSGLGPTDSGTDDAGPTDTSTSDQPDTTDPGTTDPGGTPGTAGGTGNGGTGTTGGTGSGSGGTSGGTGGGAGGGTAANQASDVGVTPTSIKVGNLVSMNGALGPNAFGPMYLGANAYFAYLNQALGGVHGRTIEFIRCDDAEDPSINQECVQEMIDQEVFALVANATRAYAGAEDIWKAGIPDIMGQPIGNAYWTYPGFIAVRGSEYPQDGETVGFKGQLYGNTTQFIWFRDNLDITKAGVFYYTIPASKQFGQHLADALRAVGIEATEFEMNFAFPNFDAAVAEMRDLGINATWDSLDVNGNQNLCRAMDRNDFTVTARVTTTQGAGRLIGEYSSPCRESVHGVTEALSYNNTANPEVQLFQDVMETLYQGQYRNTLAQWAWEGWLAAKSFTEVVESMGASPTREGLVSFYKDAVDFTMGGLFSPLNWTPIDFEKGRDDSSSECVHIQRWNEEIYDFEQVTTTPFCVADAPYRPYTPA